MKKYILVALAVITSVIFAACSSGSGLDVVEVPDSGELELVGSELYDWGDINIMGGDVSHVFKFRNAGEDELIVKTANTSCMCTSAEVTVGSDVSPKFGMHNSPMWNGVVAPGEEFEVDVVFDPMAHGPMATGPIMRVVNLETSGGDAELKVQGDVLSEKDYNQR